VNASELIELVTGAGGDLSLVGDGSLRVHAPQHALTAEIVDWMRSHKQELIDELAARNSARRPKESNDALRQMTLRDFATAKRIVPIFSEVLGEQVYFVSDNAEVAAGLYRGCVVYRASELIALHGCSPDTIRNAHAVKKVFGGSVVESE
jgi:hypothetical protein